MTRQNRAATPPRPAPSRAESFAEYWSLWLPGDSCPAAATEALIEWIELRGRRR